MTPEPARKPPVWPVFVAYGAALALLLTFSLALVAGVALLRSQGEIARVDVEARAFATSYVGIIASAGIDAALLLLVAFVATRIEMASVPRRLRLGPSRVTPLGIGAVLTGMLGLNVACGTAADLLGLHGGVLDEVARAMTGLGPGRLALAIVAIGAAPGVAEETFFRGLMQSRLTLRWGRWPGIALTSVAFGLLHMDLLQGSLACLVGVFLGWVAERFDSIRPTVLAHATSNAFSVALQSFQGGGDEGTRASKIFPLIVGAVVFVASIAVLRSRAAERALPDPSTASRSGA